MSYAWVRRLIAPCTPCLHYSQRSVDSGRAPDTPGAGGASAGQRRSQKAQPNAAVRRTALQRGPLHLVSRMVVWTGERAREAMVCEH